MKRNTLFDIADEMACSVQVTNEPATLEADAHERFSFWHDDHCIFALAIHNGEMPWPGYLLAKALMEKLKEKKA